MRKSLLRGLSTFSVLALLGASAYGQAPPPAPAGPDTPGTGPYPAMKEEDASLPAHVVYRPRDLAALGKQKLGVVAWGNGGCSDDAASTRFPLLEIDGQRYNLTGATTVIGRGTESDIVVDDNGVSRRHISLEVTHDGTILSDLGSTNGTFVEEQRITEVTLVDGNAIRIGRTPIMYWDAVAAVEE